MDDADRADSRIENAITEKLNEIRRQPSLVPCGSCYYCGDPVAPHHLFCSSDCSVDYKHLQDRRKANGTA